MNGKIKVGLIGAGVMGSNHARVVSQNPNAELAVVVDQDGVRAAAIWVDKCVVD